MILSLFCNRAREISVRYFERECIVPSTHKPHRIFCYGKSNYKPKKTNSGRRGIIKTKVRYLSSSAFSEYAQYNHASLTVIVRELDRVADQSKVEIVCVDAPPTSKARKEAIKHIGEWFPTDNIKWDKNDERPKEDAVAKTIKTPMSDLVKYIENDDIRDM